MRCTTVVVSLVGAVSAFQAGLPLPTGAAVRVTSPTIAAVVPTTATTVGLGADGPTNADAVYISLQGYPPANAHPDAQASLGLFLLQSHVVNGKPSYVHATRPNVMLWWIRKGDWCIGLKRGLGTGKCFAYAPYDRGAALPNDIHGKWKFLDNGAGWVDNVDLRVSTQPPASSPAPSTNPTTAAQRFATARQAGRAVAPAEPMRATPKRTPDAPQVATRPPPQPTPPAQVATTHVTTSHVPTSSRASINTQSAISAISDVPLPQAASIQGPPPAYAPTSPAPASNINSYDPKQAKAAMKARVAAARALYQEATDAKYRVLIKPALEAYTADDIDEEELKKRKLAARDRADGERPALKALDRAFSDYEKVIAARAAAEVARDKAEAAEDKAEGKLGTALVRLSQAIEKGNALPALADDEHGYE